MKNLLKKILMCLVAILIVSATTPELALAALNNANIISDYNFSNANPMSATDINNFLIAKGSGFANYTVPEYIDVPYPLATGGFGTVSTRQVNDTNGASFFGKSVAQLIYDETTEHNVNPRMVLATLEKESSAITGNVFRSSTVATWPLFYMYDETMAGCLNSGTNCNDSGYRQTSMDFGGAGRQIGYATAWFGLKYSQYKTTGRPLKNSSNQIVGYEQYSDPVSIDGQSISCQTAGSRILYLYTPHIQSSFYNIFSGFFGDPTATGPVTSGQDDTAPSNIRTYSGSLQLSGGKAVTSKVYNGDTLIADLNTTSWTIVPAPPVGATTIVLIYKGVDGTELSRKTIQIDRHKIADINGDSAVDGTDLSIFAAYWGKNNPSELMADLNADAVVDGTDLSIFASNWGK